MSLVNQTGSSWYSSYNVSIDPAQARSTLNEKNVALITSEDNGSKWKYYLGVTLLVLGLLILCTAPLGPLLATTVVQAQAFGFFCIGSFLPSLVMSCIGSDLMKTNEKAFQESDQPPSYAQALLSPPAYDTPSYDQVAAAQTQPQYDPNVAPPAYE